MFEACGFKIIRHYCEDVSHTMNDLGISPRFKFPRANLRLRMSAFKNKSNENFHISDEEIRSFKNHPYLKSWRLRFNKIRREFLTLRFPVSLPFGYQQLAYAEKA